MSDLIFDMIILVSFLGWARLVQMVKNVNDSTDNMVKISETADKTLIYVTKVTGVSTGAAKGTVDMLKAIACQDRVCAAVSGIGVCGRFIHGCLFYSRPKCNDSCYCASFCWLQSICILLQKG